MGKAGKALKQVLDYYNITQSKLARGLGVEVSIVFCWYYEKIDPTAENVAEIVTVLNNISKSAANDFIQGYLGDLIAEMLNVVTKLYIVRYSSPIKGENVNIS
ncbi:helix-turn-helix domain-containing protein [Umezakia ovalisporum]|uniref:helix-turn-helix domain-containing protein n=1 Tax=Umezakia ovalisporum TaxID=75695 RepID=UPI0035BB8655